MLSPGTKAGNFRRQNESWYRTWDINQEAPLRRMGVKTSQAPPFLCGQPCPPPRGGETSRLRRLCGFGFPGQAAGKGSAAHPFPFTKHRLPGVQGVKGFVWLGSSSEPALSRAGAFLCLYLCADGSRFIFTLEAFTAAQQASSSICSAEGLYAVGVHPLNAIMPQSLQAMLDEKRNTRIYLDIWNLKLLNH